MLIIQPRNFLIETVKGLFFYLLEYADAVVTPIRDLDFVSYMYSRFHNSTVRDNTLWGWYAYFKHLWYNEEII